MGRTSVRMRRLRLRGKLRIWSLGAMAAILLAGCGGGEGAGTAPGDSGITTDTEALTDDDAAGSADRFTIEAEGLTVTIEALGEASFLTLESTGAGGPAAIRTGTCASPGEVVADIGEVSTLLASQVEIKFEELTGGDHVLTVGDSSCVELQPG